jgi:sterol desaturase/sphingolipid hydroxylase (fatty acid hydroxylase superfamily)
MATLLSPPTATPVSDRPLPRPTGPAQAGPAQATRRLPLWARSLIAVVAVASATAIDRSAPLLIVTLFVLVVPFEKLFPRHRQRLRRPGLGTDVVFGLTQPLLALLGVVVGAAFGLLSLAWLPGLALRPLVLALPDEARMLLGVVLFDLATYWVHRWSHEVPLLWRFHRVHHSTERLDWVSGLRGHPFDGALLAPPFVLLLAAGFTAQLAGALAIVQIVTGLFLHANVRWRWRPLHRIVITPEFHHWHHADEPAAHNANYSVFLPLWDLLFGTYYMPRDRRPQLYGVTPPLPAGFAALIAQPFAGLPGPRQAFTHPLQTLSDARRTVCRGLRQIVASTRRRTEHGS